jgi:hypothetical protein
MLVWRDSHHLTSTYTLSLKPVIAGALSRQLGETVLGSTAPTDGDAAAAFHFSDSDLAHAKQDLAPLYGDRCINGGSGHTLKVCEYGNPDAATHVVLAGDTRAAQWAPALIELSRSRDLRISTIITSACALGKVPYEKRDCAEWTETLTASIADLNPDLILLSQSRGYRMPDTEVGVANAMALAAEFENAIRPLLGLPGRLIIIPDTPRFSFDANACLAERPEEPLLACSADVKKALPGADRPDPLLIVTDRVPSIEALELNDAICPPTGYICLPASDAMLIWQSRYLITASFAKTLADRFSRALFP